jgi:hypothetical protein
VGGYPGLPGFYTYLDGNGGNAGGLSYPQYILSNGATMSLGNGGGGNGLNCTDNFTGSGSIGAVVLWFQL